jgi:hypothetical protein
MNFQINMKKNLQNRKKEICICSSTYRLMVIQILYNLIIV